MSETKVFDTLKVASAATGICLGEGYKISDMHEISEFVCGHPVWTHELADKRIQQAVNDGVMKQFPNMPSSELAAANYQAAASKALAEYGDKVELKRGTSERTEHPVDSLARLMGDRS